MLQEVTNHAIPSVFPSLPSSTIKRFKECPSHLTFLLAFVPHPPMSGEEALLKVITVLDQLLQLEHSGKLDPRLSWRQNCQIIFIWTECKLHRGDDVLHKVWRLSVQTIPVPLIVLKHSEDPDLVLPGIICCAVQGSTRLWMMSQSESRQ
ncbi:hypothetical protein HAX54_010255 [Datura stramonium]|uniref:Uncharacterized protein n=1 Tax=Datura stramonium TaxID=4076 RepID=A0ABS8S055_DATST|nr:hypothetical protein [Datura stramonium]